MRRRRAGNEPWRYWYPALVLVIVLVGVWEVAVRRGWIAAYAFPAPSTLATAAYELATDGFPRGISVWHHILATTLRILGGFGAAVALAVPIGIVVGRFDTLYRMVAPVMAFARAIAILSLLPLVIVWFGSGELAKVVLIGYGCFWTLLPSVIEGVRQVDPTLVNAARTLDSSTAEVFGRVVLPASLPRVFAGARVALGVGFATIIGAELFGTVQGIGALIMQARNFYRTDIAIVGMALAAGLGLLLAAVMGVVERVLLPWTRFER